MGAPAAERTTGLLAYPEPLLCGSISPLGVFKKAGSPKVAPHPPTYTTVLQKRPGSQALTGREPGRLVSQGPMRGCKAPPYMPIAPRHSLKHTPPTSRHTSGGNPQRKHAPAGPLPLAEEQHGREEQGHHGAHGHGATPEQRRARAREHRSQHVGGGHGARRLDVVLGHREHRGGRRARRLRVEREHPEHHGHADRRERHTGQRRLAREAHGVVAPQGRPEHELAQGAQGQGVRRVVGGKRPKVGRQR